MTELTIRPEEIKEALAKFVSDYQPEAASREEVGTVSEAGDGIARVEGLPSAMANELLEFEDGTLGIALNLDTRETAAPALSSRGRAATATWAGSSTRWATRSTASARSRPRAAVRSRRRPPRSCSASRCTSRWRPASRRSTR